VAKIQDETLVRYEVVHERVAIRSAPSTGAPALAVVRSGMILEGYLYDCSGEPWLNVSSEIVGKLNPGAKQNRDVMSQPGGWLLINGRSVGLGELLKQVWDDTIPARFGDGKMTCMVCGAKAQTTKEKAAHERETGHAGFMF